MSTQQTDPVPETVVERLGREGVHSLAKLAGEFGGVNKSTIARWIIRGVRQPDGSYLKLEAIRYGARYRTSLPALRRFIEAISVPVRPGEIEFPPLPSDPTERAKQLDIKRRVDEMLEKGVKEYEARQKK